MRQQLTHRAHEALHQNVSYDKTCFSTSTVRRWQWERFLCGDVDGMTQFWVSIRKMFVFISYVISFSWYHRPFVFTARILTTILLRRWILIERGEEGRQREGIRVRGTERKKGWEAREEERKRGKGVAGRDGYIDRHSRREREKMTWFLFRQGEIPSRHIYSETQSKRSVTISSQRNKYYSFSVLPNQTYQCTSLENQWKQTRW